MAKTQEDRLRELAVCRPLASLRLSEVITCARRWNTPRSRASRQDDGDERHPQPHQARSGITGPAPLRRPAVSAVRRAFPSDIGPPTGTGQNNTYDYRSDRLESRYS